KQWSDYAPTLLRMVRLYYEAGELASSDALRAKGREALDTLLAEHPNYAHGYIEHARRLVDNGDDDSAMAALRKAIELDYPGREAHLRLAEIMERRRDSTEAERFRVLAAKRTVSTDLEDRWMAEIHGLASVDLDFSNRGEQ